MRRSETRTDKVSALREVLALAQEMRAGQLLAAVGEVCADMQGRGMWDASDGECLKAIWQFRRNLEAATPGRAQHNP